MSLYFPEQRLIFVHIPKTAGSSFKNWCGTHAIPHENDRCHSTWQQAHQTWPMAQQAVTFVRNPFDRMVSMFMFVGQRALLRQQRRASGKGKVKKNTTPERDAVLVDLYERGFQAWIMELAHRTPSVYDVAGDWYDRTCTQSFWLQGCEHSKIIKVEDLHQDFVWLQHTLRCATDLPQHNRSTHDHYRQYYDTDCRATVERMFAEDLDRFGYEF